MTLARSPRSCRAHRQSLPLDPRGRGATARRADRATGGRSAPAALRHDARPAARRAASSRPTAWSRAAPVVKSVTGYDVPKLLVGSLGTLGVIAEAHAPAAPAPAEERSWAFGFASAGGALEAALARVTRPIVLSRCQIVTAGALRRAGGVPRRRPPRWPSPSAACPRRSARRQRSVADIGGRAGSAAMTCRGRAFWRQVADHVAEDRAPPVAEERDPPERSRQGAAGGARRSSPRAARSGPPAWRPASCTPPWRPSRRAA